MKISVNSPCPCGSGKKYKQCCQVLHKGAKAKNALELMKSRYSAFAANDYKYIIKTTHKQNHDYSEDISTWKDSILQFSKSTQFKKLNIVEFIDGENVAYVTFEAIMFQNDSDISFTEKSKFYKVDESWLYHSGEFLE